MILLLKIRKIFFESRGKRKYIFWLSHFTIIVAMHKIVFCCHKKKLCHKRGDCDVLKAEKSLSWKLRVYYIKLVKTQRFSGPLLRKGQICAGTLQLISVSRIYEEDRKISLSKKSYKFILLSDVG